MRDNFVKFRFNFYSEDYVNNREEMLKMSEKHFGEKRSSSIGIYIRSTSDIPTKRKDIRTSSDMNELSEMAK